MVALLTVSCAGLAAPSQPGDRRGLAVEGYGERVDSYGDRVALVIGNQRYESSALAHTERDAVDMGRVLEGLGFDVIADYDLDRDGMLRRIADFGARLKRAKRGVGLVYYAGHAVEVEGQNYLLPIGAIAKLPDDRYVDVEAVSLARILKELDESGAPIKLVILDACRNNPLPSRKRTALAGMAPVEATSGTLVAYSTQPHRTALDDSLYTRSLLKYLAKPGLRLDELFGLVRAEVAAATNDGQVPLEVWGLTGAPFYFVPQGSSPVACPPGTVPQGRECLAPAASPAGGSGTSHVPDASLRMIGDSNVPATPENLQIYDLMVTYKDALQRRDADGVLALVSRDYLESGGTTDPADDYGYQELAQEVLPKLMSNVKGIQFEFRPRSIMFVGDRANVQFEYTTRFLLPELGRENWHSKSDVNEWVLVRTPAGWRILSGL